MAFFRYPYRQPGQGLPFTTGVPAAFDWGKPGPGGPLPDPHTRMRVVGPIIGRSVPPLNAFGPNFAALALWPQQVVNNSYATAMLRMYVPGWFKPPPTPNSGF